LRSRTAWRGSEYWDAEKLDGLTKWFGDDGGRVTLTGYMGQVIDNASTGWCGSANGGVVGVGLCVHLGIRAFEKAGWVKYAIPRRWSDVLAAYGPRRATAINGLAVRDHGREYSVQKAKRLRLVGGRDFFAVSEVLPWVFRWCC